MQAAAVIFAGSWVKAVTAEPIEQRVHKLLRQLQPEARIDHGRRQILQSTPVFHVLGSVTNAEKCTPSSRRRDGSKHR